ncbi:S9 family peptidase [Sphingomonas sp. KRR8]|uniref:S9 family peptidase n=1 Tax=Sphingomonas sp. KRR8 TaxID=2942996 RepID=UPI0020207D06|nr:S9 family peptidase [Sphingomonas sp. KRR8]URD61275.1 S9 family peptidase [Sphingomonas sp. KRR8]
MNHWKLFVGALLVSTAPLSPVMAQSGEDAPSTVLTGADLFNFSVASDPQISPDGRQIAYVRMTADPLKDRMAPSIWLIDVATGQQRPLVTGPGGPSSPRWSPDGKRLAYVSAVEGGSPQLFVRWMDRGDSVRVTGLPDSPSDIAWSPDGRRIAYVMRVPGDEPKLGSAPPKPEGAQWANPLQVIDKVTYRADGAGYLQAGFDHIFLVDADGGAPRRLTSGSFDHEGPLSWTPDGRTILFSANLKPDWEINAVDSEVYSLPVDGGAPVALTRRNGPDQSPRVSPDGRLIAFIGYDDRGKGYEQNHLYVMNRDGSGVRELAPGLDRSVDRLDWAGNSLVVGYEEGGSYRVSRVGLDGRVSSLASSVVGSGLDRPYAGGSWSVARDGSVAFTSGNTQSPADVSVTRGGSARRLTRLNDLWLGAKRLGEVRAFTAKAPDGGQVPSWLVLPPTYQPGTRVPMILEIHGGPYSSYGPTFSTDDQLYAAAGYAVLYTNPRGSTGYGQRFADGIEKTYPGTDSDDLMAAVDAAIAQGVADPENLFVTGGSGGGVLTAWLVGKTNRFRAAAAQKPVINWTSMALTADGVPFFAKYWMGKLPWQDPQGYWARSPLSLVGNVKTPTLVVVGSEDYRTPVSEAEQYYAALKLAGVPTTLVKVPGASHGGLTARPSQSAAKASAILAWFDRYRKR